jgi:hypothetical protein
MGEKEFTHVVLTPHQARTLHGALVALLCDYCDDFSTEECDALRIVRDEVQYAIERAENEP